VLDDTLFTQEFSVKEISAVVAHEIGHWRNRHHLILLATMACKLTIFFGLYTLANNHMPLLESYGFS